MAAEGREDERPPLDVGDRVIDRDASGTPSAARVVELADEAADEFYVPAINGTVASANPEYPRTDPVVGIKFERGSDGRQSGPTYHYPATRLEAVSNEWEAPEPKSKSQREREAVIEQHRDAFEAFRLAAEYLRDHPDETTDYFVRNYDPTIRPQTRGECSHSRDDSYRPNTPGAIVCWRCNDGGRRPRKLLDDEVVPDSAPCIKLGSRDPTDVFRGWLREDVLTDVDPERRERQVEAATPNSAFDCLISEARGVGSDHIRTRRAAMLRIAYEATVGGLFDEEYNHSKTCAFLRDLGVDTNEVLPGGDPYVGQTGGERQ